MTTIKELTDLVFNEYVANGFYSEWESVKPYWIGTIAELGLITSEVSEAMESVRHKKLVNFEIELADIAIRLFNLCRRHNIDLEKRILDKHKKNLSRGVFHGKRVI